MLLSSCLSEVFQSHSNTPPVTGAGFIRGLLALPNFLSDNCIRVFFMFDEQAPCLTPYFIIAHIISILHTVVDVTGRQGPDRFHPTTRLFAPYNSAETMLDYRAHSSLRFSRGVSGE